MRKGFSFKKRKSLKARFSLAFAGIILAGFFLAPYIIGVFVDENLLKERVTKAISAKTNRTVEISGDTSIVLFPHIGITMKGFYISNKTGLSPYLLKAESVIVTTGWAGLFSENTMKGIEFVNPDLQIETTDNNRKTNLPDESSISINSMISTLFSSHDFGNVSAKNGKITITSLDTRLKEEIITPIFSYSQTDGVRILASEYIVSGKSYRIDASHNNTTREAVFAYTEGNNTVNFTGKFDYANNLVKEISGKLSSSIAISEPTGKQPPESGNDIKLDIKADVSFNNNITAFKNVEINSPLISGSGEAQMAGFASGSSAYLALKNLDIKYFYHYFSLLSQKNKDSGMHISDILLSSFWNMPFAVKLDAQSVKAGGTTIAKLDMGLEKSSKEITINKCSFTTPENGIVNLYGFVNTNTESGYAINGAIEAEGDSFIELLHFFGLNHTTKKAGLMGKYNLKSNFSIDPKELRFTEASIILDEIIGNGVMVATIQDDIPVIDARIKLSDLNMDDYGLLKAETPPVQSDSSQAAIVYTGAFSWLKNVNYKLNGVFSLDKMISQSRQFDKVILAGSFEKGKLNLSEIMATYKNSHVKGKLDVELVNGFPEFNTDLVFDTLDMETWFPSDLDTDDSVDSAPSGKWSDRKIIFKSVRELNGKYKVSAENFLFRGFDIHGLMAEGGIKSDTFSIDSLNGKTFDSDVSMKGNLKVGDIPGFSLTFTLANADTNAIFKHFLSMDSVSGRSSISGSLATSGISEAIWITNLSGNVLLRSNDLQIIGFDLPNFSRRLSNIRSGADVVNLSKMSFSGGQTNFNSTDIEVAISNGLVTVSRAKSYTDYLEASFTGNLNLPKWNITGHSDFIIRMDEFKGMPAIRLNLDGDIDAPEKRYDLKEFETYMNRKTTERMIKEPMQ